MARQVLDNLVARGLPEPSAVLVSPLQRTLQTASLIFPGHDNIHVREVRQCVSTPWLFLPCLHPSVIMRVELNAAAMLAML